MTTEYQGGTGRKNPIPTLLAKIKADSEPEGLAANPHVSIGYGNGTSWVRYRDTIIIAYRPHQFLILNTDGWWTATTKQLINQASQEFNLGVTVKGKREANQSPWTIHYKGQVHEWPHTEKTIALDPVTGDNVTGLAAIARMTTP